MATKRSQGTAVNGKSKRPRLTLDSTKSGKISKVKVKNFMCHSFMQVDFNPNINFIIGRNGSGKSAILTALIVALGGKASDTDRSHNLKEFIKKGCSSATIEVQILNAGCLAYKPDVMGDMITIIRQLFSTGRTVYKIKSESGKIISTKRAEVLKITSLLKIMVDNPICVLTQDTARTFLNSADPKKKYTFFMKATSLEHIKNKIEEIAVMINESEVKMKEYYEEHEKLKQEVEGISKDLEKYKSMDTLKQSKIDIENEMQWSCVVQLEQDKAEAESRLQQNTIEINEITEKLTKKGALQKELEQKAMTLKSGLDEKKKETQHLAVNYKDVKMKERSQKEAYQQKANELKMLKSKLARNKDQKDMLAEEIELQEKQLNDLDVRKAERQKKIGALMTKEKELKDLCSVAEMDMASYFGNNAKLQDDMERLNSKIRDTNGRIHQTTSLIRELDTQSNNALSLYGQHMPRLLEIIKKAHAQRKFTEMPRGPLGSYIEVRDKSWAGSIEQTLGHGFLQGFFVTNGQDQKTLMQLITANFPNLRMPMIIMSKFFHKPHDITSNKVSSLPSRGLLSFLDAIRVSDPVVFNCIVDQHSAEHVLLVDSEETALELMSEQPRVPRNCRRAVLRDGSLYYPAPGFRMYSGNDRPAQLMQCSVKERQMQLTRELEGFKNELAQVQASLQDKKQQWESTQNTVRDLKETIREYNQKTQKVSTMLAQLRDEEDPGQDNIDALREELAIMERAEREINQTLSEGNDELESMRCLIDGFGEEVTKAKAEMREAENGCLLIQEKLDEIERKRSECTQGPALKRRLEQTQRLADEARAQIRQLEEKIRNTSGALDESTRPEKPRTMNVLKEKLQEVQSSIRSLTAQAIDPVKLQKDFKEKSGKLQEDELALDEFHAALERLIGAANMRHRLYIHLRRHMSSQVQHYFMFMLQMRQYQGRITLDHTDKTLLVEVDTNAKSRAMRTLKDKDHGVYSGSSQGSSSALGKLGFRDLRSLSGGERSYCTVSFLIALWNCVRLPFYFLDEFDVFMDQMNRKIIMDVLLQSARDNPFKQYVFLTPQDTSTITASDTIKIHKLADPER